MKRSSSGIDTRTEIEILSDEDRRIEAIALQLRTRKGFPTGLVPTPNPVESLTQQGLIIEKEGFITLTRAGKSLADPIASELI